MLRKAIKIISFIWSHPYNKGKQFSAFGRLFRWQLASRLMPGPIGLPFVRGTYLLANRGMSAATGNWYCGMLEYEDMEFVLQMLGKGDLFLDVGANIGAYSVLAATTGADVIAIEPIPSTFETLKNNIFLNRFCDVVKPFNFGLGSSVGELFFTSNLDCVNHVLTPAEYSAQSISVPVRTMDEISMPRIPSIIKIDVEGFESEVIAGAEKTLSHPDLKAVIMELNELGIRYGTSDVDLYNKMIQLDFVEVYFDHPTKSFVQGTSTKKCSSNIIFIKKSWLSTL